MLWYTRFDAPTLTTVLFFLGGKRIWSLLPLALHGYDRRMTQVHRQGLLIDLDDVYLESRLHLFPKAERRYRGHAENKRNSN
jgi:hypothetical protein